MAVALYLVGTVVWLLFSTGVYSSSICDSVMTYAMTVCAIYASESASGWCMHNVCFVVHTKAADTPLMSTN